MPASDQFKMRFLTAHFVMAAVVVGFATQSPSSPTQSAAATASTGIIVGRVLEATGDTPIASVIVSLSGGPLPRGINVVTDSARRSDRTSVAVSDNAGPAARSSYWMSTTPRG